MVDVAGTTAAFHCSVAVEGEASSSEKECSSWEGLPTVPREEEAGPRGLPGPVTWEGVAGIDVDVER